MASITLETTDQSLLDDLDEITKDYEGTLPVRIKEHLKRFIKGEVNALRAQRARRQSTFTPITNEIV